MNFTAGNRILVLINPVSGRGRGADAARLIGRTFRRQGLEPEVVVLSGPDSAREQIRCRAADCSAVVVVGGDGTINEAGQAIYSLNKDLPLGVIPWGLSNCLARHFRLKDDLDQAVRTIARRNLERIGLAQAREKSALAFVGVGFDAMVVAKVAAGRKGPVSNGRYILAALALLFRNSGPELGVRIDGRKIEGRYHQVIVSAISNYARFFTMPRRPGFWAYLFKGSDRSSLLRSFRRLGLKRDLAGACSRSYPVEKNIEFVTLKGPGRFQTDGDPGGELPVTVKIIPEALSFIVP